MRTRIKATEETKKKMSQSQKRIGNIPPSMKGKVMSQEQKNKINKL